MKIGLVTIAHGQNYGNRLQNFAIQMFFEEKGYKIETIRHPYYGFSPKVLTGIFIKRIFRYRYTRIPRRIWKFTRFNKKYIRFSKRFIQSGEVDKKLSRMYDVFLCGSDQIWNPDYFTEKDSYFLSFVEGKKKIALAASFGVDEIKGEEERERIIKRLNELTAISVREKSGQELVRELSCREATLVIDPTMSITADKWMQIERKPKYIKEGEYVLFYLLGNYSIDNVKRLREKFISQGKKVILLENEYSNLGLTTDEEFSMDPAEFIWLVRNSNMVITDSFHAIVFSLLFHKKFTIIKRDTLEGDISSRIKNLIEMFHIKNAYCKQEKVIEPAIVDYQYVDKVLEDERKKFKSFIDSNI